MFCALVSYAVPSPTYSDSASRDLRQPNRCGVEGGSRRPPLSSGGLSARGAPLERNRTALLLAARWREGASAIWELRASPERVSVAAGSPNHFNAVIRTDRALSRRVLHRRPGSVESFFAQNVRNRRSPPDGWLRLSFSRFWFHG